MRKVMVSRLEQNSDVPNKRWELVENGEAVFHQFGCDYEEFESGPGNFSTAIVEWPDGRVENVPAQNIRFLDATGFGGIPTQHNNKEAK
jgi:hypothetical protein